MQLTEQHVIDRHDPRYAVIDDAAFKSKNLYNAALYEMRQAFFNERMYLKYEEIHCRMQPHEAYKALPAKVSQHVLKQLADAWKAFREAKAAYEEDPSIVGDSCLGDRDYGLSSPSSHVSLPAYLARLLWTRLAGFLARLLWTLGWLTRP